VSVSILSLISFDDSNVSSMTKTSHCTEGDKE
jgi:hypothetical protein